MLRSIAHIVAAIAIANPSLPKSTQTSYARTLQSVAHAHDFDPYTAVAIGYNESRWRAGTVGGAGGKCYGLFQVCVQFVEPACQANFASEACLRRRTAYLDGQYAIRALGSSITTWRRYCRRRTGRSALFARWLAGYQGVDAARGTVCNQRRIKGRWVDVPLAPVTQRVIRYRRQLIRKLHGRGKSG